MNWLLAHVYVVTIAIVGFAVVAGSAVMYERSSRPEERTATGWARTGGVNLFQRSDTRPELARVEQLSESLEPNTEYRYIPIQTSPVSGETTLPEEWESLLTQLIQKDDVTEVVQEPESTNAYSFIPQGLVSIPEPTDQLTEFQRELFEYGNRVGSHIRTFDDSHRYMLTTLKDAYADRTNVSKRTAAEQIGLDYEKLGTELEEILDVPPAVAKMHAAVAAAYKEAGQKMIVKLRAESDDEFLAAMHSYNDSVLEFTRSFVALATYLSAAGVRFSSTDAGSVFTFSPM